MFLRVLESVSSLEYDEIAMNLAGKQSSEVLKDHENLKRSRDIYFQFDSSSRNDNLAGMKRCASYENTGLKLI